MIACVSVSVPPALLVTVNTTLYVPLAAYVLAAGVAPVAVVPSP